MPDSGLYCQAARWYDPVLSRFVQADTVVPELSDPQGFNRYSYVRNNPLIYTDPSGHCGKRPGESAEACIGAYLGLLDALGERWSTDDNLYNLLPLETMKSLIKWIGRGVSFMGNWSAQDLLVAALVLDGIENAFGGAWDKMSEALGFTKFGYLTLLMNEDLCDLYGPDTGAFPIPQYNVLVLQEGLTAHGLLHEFGHLVDNHLGGGE